jgi:hypothetical protein
MHHGAANHEPVASMTGAVPLEIALPDARHRFARFLQTLRPKDRILVFCHYDADGLAAGSASTGLMWLRRREGNPPSPIRRARALLRASLMH